MGSTKMYILDKATKILCVQRWPLSLERIGLSAIQTRVLSKHSVSTKGAKQGRCGRCSRGTPRPNDPESQCPFVWELHMPNLQVDISWQVFHQIKVFGKPGAQLTKLRQRFGSNMFASWTKVVTKRCLKQLLGHYKCLELMKQALEAGESKLPNNI